MLSPWGNFLNGARDDEKLNEKPRILKITDEGTTATRLASWVCQVPRCGKHLRRRQPQRPGSRTKAQCEWRDMQSPITMEVENDLFGD